MRLFDISKQMFSSNPINQIMMLIAFLFISPCGFKVIVEINFTIFRIKKQSSLHKVDETGTVTYDLFEIIGLSITF
jgi:hypothetical protein